MKRIMKLISIIVLALLMITPSCVTMQVKGDSEITAISEIAIGTIAQVIKRDHRDDIDVIVKYCDEILAQESDEVVQEMFLFGYDYLIDRHINDPIANGAVKSIGRLFRVEPDVKFDGGEVRLAKVFAEKLRDLVKE